VGKTEAVLKIIQAIIGLLQAVALVGVSTSAITDWLTANSAMVVAIGSAVLGIASVFLPALKKANPSDAKPENQDK
jgi:hypothetical protein